MIKENVIVDGKNYEVVPAIYPQFGKYLVRETVERDAYVIQNLMVPGSAYVLFQSQCSSISPPKNGHIDIDSFLSNLRWRASFLYCFEEQGGNTSWEESFKGHMKNRNFSPEHLAQVKESMSHEASQLQSVFHNFYSLMEFYNRSTEETDFRSIFADPSEVQGYLETAVDHGLKYDCNQANYRTFRAAVYNYFDACGAYMTHGDDFNRISYMRQLCAERIFALVLTSERRFYVERLGLLPELMKLARIKNDFDSM